MKYHLKYPTIRILALSSLLIFVLLILGVVSASAQDTTPTPHAVATQEATLEAAPISTQETAPIIADSGGGDITINTGSAPTTPTTPTTPPNGLLSLTVGEVLAILAGTLALCVAVGKILWDGNQPGESLDARLTARVEATTQDKDYMEALIQAYKSGNEATHKAIDSLVSVLQIIAPQTGIKLDDAALAALRQIQQGMQPPTEEIATGGAQAVTRQHKPPYPSSGAVSTPSNT